MCRRCFTHWPSSLAGPVAICVTCFAVLAVNTALSRERLALRYVLPFIVNLSRGRDILTP
jgi:hypothetical protein